MATAPAKESLFSRESKFVHNMSTTSKASPQSARILRRSNAQDKANISPVTPLPIIDRDYTVNDIQDRLTYTDHALQKLPPIGIRALRLYKEACLRLLNFEDSETCKNGEEVLAEAIKNEWKSTILTYDQVMPYTACLVMARSADAQELQEQLVMLRKAAFYARYGDIFAEVCTKLKRDAEAKKFSGWKIPRNHYWTKIAANLKYEADAYNRVLTGEHVHDQCPTYLAISHASNRVGLNMKDMIQAIGLYSEKNQVDHTNIIPTIKSGHFFDLAKYLYNDTCDIPLLISDDHKLTELLKHLIESIIDLWFDRDEMDRDNYQMWTPTQELRDHRRQLHKNLLIENTVQETINAEIVKSLKKRLRVAGKNEMVGKLFRDFQRLSGAENLNPSSQLEVECERAERMKIEWSKIINLALGNRKISDTYFQNYG